MAASAPPKEGERGMSNILEYKGFSTQIAYSAEDHVLYGKIDSVADLVSFESRDAEQIEQEFHDAVDDYLSCLEPHVNTTGIE